MVTYNASEFAEKMVSRGYRPDYARELCQSIIPLVRRFFKCDIGTVEELQMKAIIMSLCAFYEVGVSLDSSEVFTFDINGGGRYFEMKYSQ